MTAKIASIHFAPVSADRSTFTLGQFSIPASPDGEPVFLTITDMNQRDQGCYGDGGGRYRPSKIYVVPGHEIARDIVAAWTTTGQLMDTDAHPGIWVVRDHLPLLDADGTAQKDAEGHAVWREATPEEQKSMWAEDLAKAKAADRAYAMHTFDYWAGRVQDKPAMRKFITPQCRLGAARYGFTGDWLSAANSTSAELCPYCKAATPAGAVKCPNCKEVVNVEAYAKLEAEKQRALVKSGAIQKGAIQPPLKEAVA